MSAIGLTEHDQDYKELLEQVDTFSLGKQSKKVIQMIKKEENDKVKKESLNSLQNGDDLGGDTCGTLRNAFKKVPVPKKTRRMVFLSLSKEGPHTYVRFMKRDEWTDRAIHKSVCTELLSLLDKDPSPFNEKRLNFFQNVVWYQNIKVITYKISDISFDWSPARTKATFSVARAEPKDKTPYIH